jgi:hypothetical protein
MAGYSTAQRPAALVPRLPAHGEGHDRVGHFKQRVDRRASGSVAVRSGIGRGKRRGASGEGEVVQRGEDHRGVPLARRRRLDRARRLIGLTQGDGDAFVQRRCFGRVDLTEVSVHLGQCAGPTHGHGACCGRHNQAQAVRRLGAVRQFARYRALLDPATEVPPPGAARPAATPPAAAHLQRRRTRGAA